MRVDQFPEKLEEHKKEISDILPNALTNLHEF